MTGVGATVARAISRVDADPSVRKVTVSRAACLVFAIKTIGIGVPWHRILLVWSAGIGAGSFSPTPGGIGVVDVTMTAALVAAGIRPPDAVAAVLLYRIINSKFILATVWVIHRSIRQRRRWTA